MLRSFLRTAAVLAASCLATSSLASAEPRHRLSVLAFNVLASIWASPVRYPREMDASLLERGFRRERTTQFLTGVADRFDVVCLQEVNRAEFPFYLAALGPDFAGFMAENDPDFWSNWLVPELPWEPNGTAVFMRRSAIETVVFDDVALSDDGNHAATATGLHRSSGVSIRIFSVHLDSDRNDNRVRELRSLLDMAPPDEATVDVICGDVNEDTQIGSASGLLTRAGFVDVLAGVGNREATHPFSSSYYRSSRWAIIDHVLVRNGSPRAGDVFDFGLWSIADEVERIERNFEASGSDHFPVGATIEF